VLTSLERWLWQRRRLRVNREKIHMAHLWSMKFLGYGGTWERAVRLRVAPTAAQRLKTHERHIVARGPGPRLADTVYWRT